MITLDVSDGIVVTRRIEERLLAIKDVMNYAGPLMESIERRIAEGNRKGVLAGLDKDGNPAPPVTYRPINPTQKLTPEQRLGQNPRVKRGMFAGKGKHPSGMHNNLTTAEYQRLTGPRLAPRFQFSRVISNFATGHGRNPGNKNIWFAEGAWIEVVSRTGFHFLPVHFEGKPLGRNGPVKRYDLRGIRPADMKLCHQDVYEWAKLTIRTLWKRPHEAPAGE